MRASNHAWGLRVAVIALVAISLIFLGQIISFWWIVITAAVSSAVWTMIWLWPEGVPERIENDNLTSSRLVNK